MVTLTDKEFQRINSFVRENYGINLEKKKFLIESKLWIELARCKVDNYTDYLNLVMTDKTGANKQRMIDLLTTNYTYFCREDDHFTFLTKNIIKEIQKLPKAKGKNSLNILCAGCATGQESYTIAMHLLDCQRLGKLSMPFHIVATDISLSALTKAKRGRYNSAEYARIPKEWKSKYCDEFVQGEFTIKDSVKALITFQQQNLLRPMAMERGTFQVAFCRNVLIYFKEAERNKLVEAVTYSIEPGGYFFIGHTETLFRSAVSLEYIKPAVYKKQKRHEYGNE